jgi:MSHA biogenesis protein MshO
VAVQRGFTLIELVMVIVIMGVIGGIVSVFMKGPIDAYFASARRAALTDVADTTVRRMTRDIRMALPNSMHTPNPQCAEFIPTKAGGRYRADVDNSSGAPLGDILDFDPTHAADTAFDMLGANSTVAGQAIAIGDLIAVYNLGPGINDAYVGNNTSNVTGVTAGALPNETHIAIASKLFPLPSGGNRFHVISKDEKVVAFVCSGGTLYRTTNSAMAKTADGSACSTTAAGTLKVVPLANHVGSCGFEYNGTDLQSNAMARLWLSLTDSGETVSLYNEVHWGNTP